MKLSFKFIFTVFSLMLMCTSQAQTTETNPMKPFTDLNGKWESNDAVINLGGQVFNVNYFVEFDIASDEFAVVVYEKCNIPGVGKLKATNLIGYDPGDGKYHWYTVDNFGTTHEHIGSFTDATHFYMEHKSVKAGKQFVEKIWLDWIGQDRLKLKLVATSDDVVEEIAEATFRKKGHQ